MVKSGIKIYARVKPTKKPVGLYEIGESNSEEHGLLSIRVLKSEASGYVNNKKEVYSFQFNKVFDQGTKQDEIFESVAQNVIDNCLEGYNGTIFAYGQTGSGKTFTITGGVEKYADRGIIPRTLTYIFLQYSKSPGIMYTTDVSYMEIYNESCYDLLDPKHEASALEDLPKVILMEGEDGAVHLKNLSLHSASSEEEALNWLFLGDTNRMIAETPMNMASTRSHCIFTIYISSREPGSNTVRKSKLHLVDLAGSERVGKTGVGGNLLTEAKYINLSLHFLEQVIVALSDKSRSHIPYRNSMMTSVLRDSLGGNCMTTMIATCAVDKRSIDETISTCRFSQRVALVKNEALLNEELDPKLMVLRLKQKVQELKDELSLATGEERTDELTEEEKEKCVELVQAYIQDPSPEALLQVGADMRKIQFCFQLLKVEILKRRNTDNEEEKEKDPPNTPNTVTPASPQKGGVESSHMGDKELDSRSNKLELEMIRDRLLQRDSEISILLRMLKQERKRADRAEYSLKTAGLEIRSISPVSPDRVSPVRLARSSPARSVDLVTSSAQSSDETMSPQVKGDDASVRGSQLVDTVGSVVTDKSSQDSEQWEISLKAELSRARQEAFDAFRKKFADVSGIEQHKKVLKVKYAEAKALGERVNTTRVNINKLKSQIEKYRISRGIQGLTDAVPDQKEETLKKDLESEKIKFKSLYDKLRVLKTEIEHVQHLLQKAKVKIQRDFEEWWKVTHNSGSNPRAAWRTPSTSESSRSQEVSEMVSPSPRGHHHLRCHQQAIAAQFSYQEKGTHNPSHSPLKNIDTGGSDSSHVMEKDGKKSLFGSTHPAPDENRDTRTNKHTTRTTSSSGTHSLSPSSLSRGEREDHKKSPHTTVHNEKSPHSTVHNEKYQPKQKHLFSISKSHHGNHNRISEGQRRHSVQSSIPLTGDAKADADIIAFYKARQKLIQRRT